jgi:hypothetical protein
MKAKLVMQRVGAVMAPPGNLAALLEQHFTVSLHA